MSIEITRQKLQAGWVNVGNNASVKFDSTGMLDMVALIDPSTGRRKGQLWECEIPDDASDTDLTAIVGLLKSMLVGGVENAYDEIEQGEEWLRKNGDTAMADAVREVFLTQDSTIDTERGFHETLHNQPENTAAAGAYADWLEEQGKPAIASVIRSHAGISRMGGPTNAGHKAWTREIYGTSSSPAGGHRVYVSEGQLELHVISRSRPGVYLCWVVNVGFDPEPWVIDLIDTLRSECN